MTTRELSVFTGRIFHRLVGIGHGSQQLYYFRVRVIFVFVHWHTQTSYGRWRFGLVIRLINGFATGRMAGLVATCDAGFAYGLALTCAAGFTNGLAPTCAAGFAKGFTNGLANGRENFLPAGLENVFAKGCAVVFAAARTTGDGEISSSPRSSGRVRAVVGL